MTNLAEATADPLLVLTAGGYPTGPIALETIRMTYGGLDQDDIAVESPPPHTTSEGEQNDESLLNDQ